MKKGLIGLAVVGLVILGALFGSKQVTKNQGTELAMALDNVNPLVKVSTVYALTNTAVKKGTGQMGETIYTYRMETYDQAGNVRWLTFTADKRLRLKKYLKIETKGQNVNSWTAVEQTTVPVEVVQRLVES
ncbi:hypothetical protein C5Z26_04635 [Lactobacillus sp. CBA3606]|uniref:YxeA family protein n=1 Tax=Lactobacillus sp. CBA3606 TaxID=2099789 RepID=UPI000CFD61CD|nr:YxeA family protein [Lactobacillus sp. CBA3606]AVK63432.1 hypothetical protein C5Z26_04635 [Lactobacillus sp. CBA3606]